MEEIEVVNKRFDIPERFHLSKTKRRLTVRTPWSSRISRLNKDDITVSVQQYFRHEEQGDKPYVPEDMIEIDGILFKAKIIE